MRTQQMTPSTAKPSFAYAAWHARLRSANTPAPIQAAEPRPVGVTGRGAGPSRLAA